MTGVKTSFSLLDRILAPGGLTVVFQPIFALPGTAPKLHALDCRVRGPVGTNLEEPCVLAEYARHKRAESLVDRACLTTAMQTVSALLPASRLPIHLHVTTLAAIRTSRSFC